MNKKKIINDPIYGFINVESELIFDIIEHPYFQRLRRIRQLGLTDFVYPGALHTRFHHALGAMHLMGLTLNNLRLKGHDISDKEYESAQIAILLHDIGHGPFSHTLEFSLLKNIHHEELSLIIMQEINKQFRGALDLALAMFKDSYKRKFFHQLISGQLDIDRLDYLKRDGFYTGVSEGTIGSDRIIKLFDIVKDQLVLDEKGIYSIEHFLIARRVMYWQVYLHKTTVSAENMLIQLVKRAQDLAKEGDLKVYTCTGLDYFLNPKHSSINFQNNNSYLEAFLGIDDYDVWVSIKKWLTHPDFVLSYLSKGILERKLFKISISAKPFDQKDIDGMTFEISRTLKIDKTLVNYFLIKGVINNEAYVSGSEKINILRKGGKVEDIAEASDLPNIKAMSKIVKKHYLCSPKYVSL
jgi:HD superfamily phosphohydrolase